MAVYVATLRGTYASQQIINRFAYVSTVEPTGVNGSNMLAKYLGVPAVSLLFAEDTVLGEVQDLSNSQYTFDELEVVNLYDDADFYVAPFPSGVVGADSEGTPCTPFIAYGLRSNRITRAIRRGTKRIVGVVEENMAAGGFLEAPALLLLQDLADAMSAVLNPDNTDSEGTYVPSVLHYKPDTSPAGNPTSAPWPTEAEQLANAAIGVTWEPYTTVRSQTSRQYGRGA